MNLFLNFVSGDWLIILFDNDRHIIDIKKENILLRESSKLLNIIDSFLKKNNLNYKDIENIIVVNWPWSFTWVRTISLIINSISYIFNTSLTPINYFELFDKYPIVKTSSKRDLFIKKTSFRDIEIISNQELELFLKDNKIKKLYWDFDTSYLREKILLTREFDYNKLIKNLDLEKNNLISPFYFKKPNIQ